MNALRSGFGSIDIYLFDQLLKGRIPPGSRILDAGCGGGRNLVYFLGEDYEVHGVDPDRRAIEGARELARHLRPDLPTDRFRQERLEAMSHEDHSFDVVILNAVLHFARDDAEFLGMLEGAWRVLKPGGLFFCRLTSSIGIESLVEPIEGRVHRLPDGSARFLVTLEELLSLGDQLGGRPVDPIKTTTVQNLRAMTTWVLTRESETTLPPGSLRF